MKGNILVVEDEISIRKLITIYLKKQEYNVFEAEDGEEALKFFKSYQIDLVILDIMIPYIDGFKVCQYIRSFSDVPIIMLTAKSLEEDKLKGYDYGTDEYVTKPFSPKVLVARVNALLKRANGNVSRKDEIYKFGPLTIDINSGKVILNRCELKLTHKEYDLLIYLIRNKGIILSKQAILDNVWGMDYIGDPRTVDTHIRRLREKLCEEEDSIVTVRGRGYKFEVKK